MKSIVSSAYAVTNNVGNLSGFEVPLMLCPALLDGGQSIAYSMWLNTRSQYLKRNTYAEDIKNSHGHAPLCACCFDACRLWQPCCLAAHMIDVSITPSKALVCHSLHFSWVGECNTLADQG